MKDRELPTIARLVAELDGSYMGTTLYGIVKDMDWGQYGHRVGETNFDCLVFESPVYNKLRGTYSVSYYDNYPKNCIPSRSKLEVELLSEENVSLFIASEFKRNRDGVEVSLHHRDGRSAFPIYGPTRLYGDYAKELKRWYQEVPGVDPIPSPMNEDGDLILLTHFALASAVSWRTNSLGTIPYIDRLKEPLEKMIRSTYDYDQKTKLPPRAV